MKNVCIGLVMMCCFVARASAQLYPEQMRQFTANYKTPGKPLNSIAKSKTFYAQRDYALAWVTNRSTSLQMIKLLEGAETFGLDTTHYHLHELNTFLDQPAGTLEDSLLFELRLTDAALHFLQDLAYGSTPPALGYNGLGYSPSCYEILPALSTAADNNTLNLLVEKIQPASIEYNSLKAKLNQLQQMAAAPAFKDERVSSGTVTSANKPLLKRLWQLGMLDSIPSAIPDSVLKIRVKQVQQLFNLPPDGYLRQALLRELNVPLKTRIAEVKLALNTIRWLYCAKRAGPVLVVNIPSATLLVYQDEKVILESRIIVGKSTNRTPTLASKVNEVIFYPYWMVPKSIATKELLPLIKKNTGYLDASGIQVLNQQGRIVNPYSVNWHQLSAANFPYVLRQSTGCDNSLGIVKLNFYNPFNVYLHDTPTKSLFASNRRYYSHGCMRVQKAMDVAHLLLAGNTIAADTIEEKGCLRNQSPIHVQATVPMPVFVLYNTAWVDSAAVVRFHQDVYGRLTNIKK